MLHSFLRQRIERRLEEERRRHTLQGHDETTLALDHLSNHVVNEIVLIPDALGFKVLPVVLLEDLLEEVLETAILLLENGVLGAHVQRQLLHESNLEAGVHKAMDQFICFVLQQTNTTAREVVDCDCLWLAVLGSEDQLQLTGAGDDPVLSPVLITKGVTANDNRLGPARHQTRDAGDDNGFTEDFAAKDVTDGAVGRQPHFLQLELLDTALIGSDGGALHTNPILLDSLCSVNGDLVVGLVTVLNSQVVVLEVDVKVRQDQLCPMLAGTLAGNEG